MVLQLTESNTLFFSLILYFLLRRSQKSNLIITLTGTLVE